jgi:hypothetical protein
MVLYENCPVHRSQRYLFHIQIQNSRDFKNGKTGFAMIAYFRFAQRIYHSRKLYVPPDKSTFWRKCIMRAYIESLAISRFHFIFDVLIPNTNVNITSIK